MTFYDLKDEKQVKEYLNNLEIEYKFQCYNEKSADGCHRLAAFFGSVRTDFVKAGGIYKMTCDEFHHGHSCFKYGNYKVIGRDGEKSIGESLEYHKKGCSYGYISSCHNVGLIHCSSKYGQEFQNYAKGIEYFEKACKEKNSSSCHHLGGMYIEGKGPLEKNMSKALDYSLKACELGHMLGCVNAGLMYKKGDGCEKNEKLARKCRLKANKLHQEMTEQHQTLKFSE